MGGWVWLQGRSATSELNPLHPAPPKSPPDHSNTTGAVAVGVQPAPVASWSLKVGGFVMVEAVAWSTRQMSPPFV
jgi:hypothetical protein